MLNLVDYSVSGFPLLFVGFLECLAVNWIYGRFQVNTCLLNEIPLINWLHPLQRATCVKRLICAIWSQKQKVAFRQFLLISILEE